jgi:hypothetical protein
MSHIPSTIAPNLAPFQNDYDKDQALQFANQLRLYFNQLDSNNNAVKSSIDGLITLQWLGDN